MLYLRSPSVKAIEIKNMLLYWRSGFCLHKELAPLCKTITADNNLEFTSISKLETEDSQVFFAHPYAAWKQGSNERHNSLLRRMVPKNRNP